MWTPEELLPKLLCPDCRSKPLTFDDRQAALQCPNCGSSFPIIEGVPILFPSTQLQAVLQRARGRTAAKRSLGATRMALRHWKAYELADYLPDSTDGNWLLSFGCGDGADRDLLTRRGFQVVAFDVHRTPGTDLLCDGHVLPFENQSFDVVTSLQVLEHLHAPWVAVSEISRVLRPGGWFVGSVAFLKPYHRSYFHLTYLGVRSLLEANKLYLRRIEAAQSSLAYVAGGVVPVGSATRRLLGLVQDILHRTRARLWRLRTGLDPRHPCTRFDPQMRLTFLQFDRLRVAATVVFGAQKHG